MIFQIPDPDRVLITHSGELKHDFVCGVQKPYKVSVDYAILRIPGVVRRASRALSDSNFSDLLRSEGR
jgi:hypothetical protein